MTNTMTPTNRPAAAQLCDIIVRKDATIVALTKQLKIATEALEVARSEATRGAETAGCDGWRADAMCRSIAKLTAQALARIKEVG